MDGLLAHQTVVFLESLFWGAVLGLVYDMFRVARICVKSGVILTAVQDVLYFAICFSAAFLFLLGTTNGRLRVCCIIGMFLGALIYHLSCGNLVVKLSRAVIDFIDRSLIKPLIRLICRLNRGFTRFAGEILSKIKKAVSFLKIHLKQTAQLLYNHNRSMFLNMMKKSGVQNKSKGRQRFHECRGKKS